MRILTTHYMEEAGRVAQRIAIIDHGAIVALWDRQFGFLKEMLVAPAPRLQIMIGRTLGSATVATIQGLLIAVACVLAGFRPVSMAALPLALPFLVLIATVFCALGAGIGATLQDLQGFQLIMNFLLALAIVAVAFLALGARQFSRIQI